MTMENDIYLDLYQVQMAYYYLQFALKKQKKKEKNARERKKKEEGTIKREGHGNL